MSNYDDLYKSLVNMMKRDSAIKEIKNNPAKYPEFDFWVPGYDAESWADKAIKDFDKLVPDMLNSPVVFKLIVMRHYRKLSQICRKSGKKDFVNSTEFYEDLTLTVKKLHPEFFQ